MNSFFLILSLLSSFLFSTKILAATSVSLPLSEQVAATAMSLWKESLPKGEWTYEQGIMLKGMEGVWLKTGKSVYFKYIKKSLDKFIKEDGKIRTYEFDDYRLDDILSGRSVTTLYTFLNEPKYLKAMKLLRLQIKKQPRTPSGGFWHKKKYQNQMWLDGAYMAQPFYAQYSILLKEEANFDDIAKQFILMDSNMRDASTGLLYHGWDQSRMARWSDKKTGLSQSFWSRSIGWYAMALVDVLELFPPKHPKRLELLGMLNRLAEAVVKYQNPSSGLWYNVMDKGNLQGNYFESSAACMFVYTFAKAVRLGFLPPNYLTNATNAYNGILSRFIEATKKGTNLKGIIRVASLGDESDIGVPRDGSFKYYNSERIVTNDPKGIGAFLLASVEMEKLDKK